VHEEEVASSAKIRTYYYPRDRITVWVNLTVFMDGEMQGVIDALPVA
jgi:protein subunit release factor A